MPSESTAGDAPTGASDTLVVVLAAGAGTRFTGPGHKLLAELGGRPLIRIALDHAVEAAVGPVLVVTGAVELPPLPAGVEVIRNPSWADGQATSVQHALDVARGRAAEAVVIGLGDQPFVTPESWRAVAAVASPIAVATYDGRRGNPVRLHRSVWDLLPTTGDEGARALMRVRPELVQQVPCPGSGADIDTLEELERWQNNS